MRTWWLKAKQSIARQIIWRAYARWVEEDGDQRAATFALLLSLLPLAILLVAAGSLFVEREVATQAVVKLVNHHTPLTSQSSSI